MVSSSRNASAGTPRLLCALAILALATGMLAATAAAEGVGTEQAPPTFDIRGVVTDGAGNPLPGVEMTADGHTVSTDGNGMYRFQDLDAGTYTITPSMPEYDFAPASFDVTVGPSARDINFVGTLRTYEISGTVSGAGGGIPSVVVSAGTRSGVAGADGGYTIEDVPSGVYTVSCSRDADSDGYADYRYTPATRTVAVDGGDVTGVNFSATLVTFTISGIISDSSGHRIAGVSVTAGDRSAVTSEAGRFTIAGVPPSTVTVTPSKGGVAFDPPGRQVTVPPDSTGSNFTAYTEFAHSFPAGLGLVAVPADPPDGRDRAVDVFGTTSVARWDPSASPAAYVAGGTSPDHLELFVRPGAAFFVHFDDIAHVSVPGNAVSGDGTYSVGVETGWNMIGNMYQTALPLGNMTASSGTRVRPFAFVYDRNLGGYQMISRDPAVNAARNYLEAWEGAWFKATGAAGTLTIAAPGATSTSGLVTGSAAEAEVGEGGWLVPIVARAAGRADVTTVAGVAETAESAGCRVENPPAVPGGVDVYFTADDGSRLAHDVRPAGTAETTWSLVVETDVPNAQVELTLPDLSGVPGDRAVYLTDLDTGERMYARTTPGYVFEAGADGAVRHFELEVAARGANTLAIRSAAAHSGEAGVMVTYDLTSAARATIDVLNMAGRRVRQLVQGRAAKAGQNQELWDLRSGDGTMVPGGTYLIRVEAVADNGQRVQALRPVQLAR